MVKIIYTQSLAAIYMWNLLESSICQSDKHLPGAMTCFVAVSQHIQTAVGECWLVFIRINTSAF
jgi:hypothetical protein